MVQAAVHDLQIPQHMLLLCRTATDGRRAPTPRARVRLYCSACNYYQPAAASLCSGRSWLLAVVALVKDLAGEHGRLDDPAYDGRRLADAALVPRERRPRRAHPVEAAQQVLVAPRVQVVICAKKKSIGSGQSVNGKKKK